MNAALSKPSDWRITPAELRQGELLSAHFCGDPMTVAQRAANDQEIERLRALISNPFERTEKVHRG